MNAARLSAMLSFWLVAGLGVAMPVADTWDLIVVGSRDETAGFVAREEPGWGRRLLAWPEGLVSAPDTVAWLAADEMDLAITLRRQQTRAVGADGVLDLSPARYDLDRPLLVSDGVTSAYLTAGRLEVTERGLIYRRPAPGVGRGGTFFILAGLVVGTAVLLRAARRRTRRS